MNFEYKEQSDEEKDEENSNLENSNDNDKDNSLSILNNLETQNFDFSINDYVSKLRKKLLLIEKTNGNEIVEEKKNDNKIFQIKHGEKTSNALNLSQIPFMKLKINQNETIDEINYIFNKKTRSLNEVIYLQHFLNLYDIKSFQNLKSDNLNINEVMFNISIILNMHKYQKKEILFKYGDFNDKIFFIFSGSVSLLEPIEKKSYMTLEQYIEYLNKLINLGEYELVRKIIDRNRLYKNNNAVVKIKNNNEKEIKKIITEKMKINRDINKLNRISSIEFNLNIESKDSYKLPNEIINQNEIISIEDYKKRILPPFRKEKDIKKKQRLFFSVDDKRVENSPSSNNRDKHAIIYYEYELKKTLSPFNIIGELPQYNDNLEKNPINNQNKKRGENQMTVICNEPSKILFFNLNTYEKFVKQRQESISMKNISSILEVPFFKGLNASIFKEKYFNLFTLYNYKNGEFIFRQEEKMKNLYFIKSGEIELIMKASMFDINKILEKIEKINKIGIINNDILKQNKKKKKIKINNEDEEIIEIINQIKNDKKIMKWRIMRLNYRDIIGINEILDLNDNNYYMSAKCTSYISEIFSIDYTAFKDMINDDKGMKMLYEDYCSRKEDLIYKRLDSIKKIYINDKFRLYKKKILKNISFKKDTDINYNNLSKKRNEIKYDLINNLLENSLSGKNLRINSDIINAKNNIEIPLEKGLYTLNPKNNNNKLNNAKYSSYKTKTKSQNSPFRSIKALEEFKTSKNSKKMKIKKTLSFFDDIDEKDLFRNQRYNSENSPKMNIHKFKKSKTYLGLVKFKEFNNLIKNNKYSGKKNTKLKIEINPNFNKYLKEVRRYKLDSAKKPKINPFSYVFFPFQKNNINIKTNDFNCIERTRKLEKFNFNNIECLVLDKYIDSKEYKKNEEKNYNSTSNKRQLSLKQLRKTIKWINIKNKFPQHLIRRVEGERKINYFPEKLLHLQNKKGIFF